MSPKFPFPAQPVFGLLFCVSVLAAPASQSFAQSPMPKFNGQRVSVSETDASRWQPLEGYIRNIEQTSQQTYFVVVVKTSGNGSRATVAYTDRLQAEWIQQATNKHVEFSTKRAILILLDLQNRQLAVNTGSELQQDYGLRGQTIDRQLVVPFFVPLARANSYVEGLKILIAKFEERIESQDKNNANKKQQFARRSQKVREDAIAAIASATTLSANVQLLIAGQSDTGLDLATPLNQTENIQRQLEQLRSTINNNPIKALKKANAHQQALESIRNEVRSMTANQVTAAERLVDVRAVQTQIAELIEQISRDGIAVAHVGKKADQSSEALAAAETLISTKPNEALQAIDQQATVAASLLAEAKALPERKQSIGNRLESTAAERKKADSELRRAESLGVDVASFRSALTQVDEKLTDAKLSSVWDYDATEAHLDSADATMKSQVGRISAAADDRYFKTRTLPKAVAIGLCIVIGLVLLTLRFLHLRLRWPLEKQLKDYKTKVVELSDSLDELKHRHKMLPFTDTDFSEPMSGETLTTYTAIQDSLDTYRQRWLALMDTWQIVQNSLDEEQFLGRKSLAAAQIQLDTAPVDDVIESIRDNCKDMLDRLEQAHESQAFANEKVDQSLMRLQKQIDDVRQVELATSCYEIELKAALQERDSIAEAKIADPLGNVTVLDEVLGEVVRIGKWTEQILHHHSGAKELSAKLGDLTQSTDKHRSIGFRFCEDGTDPSELFPGIRHHQSECLNLLNRGEAKTAAEHLKQGFGLVASANERIEQQVFCKELCLRESKLRVQEQRRLESGLQTARTSQAELRRSFDDGSFADVAGNPELAEQAMETSRLTLNEAINNGGDDVQFYVKAGEQFGQVQQQQNEIAVLLESVDQRLKELESLRARVTQNLSHLNGLSSSVQQLLDSSAADRPAANQRFRHAEAALAQAKRLSLANKPDWQQVVDQANLAEREFENARSMAEQDQRLAREAYNELNHAESQIRSAQSFYRQGFRAETSLADNQYRQAKQMLAAQDYEACVRLANLAVSSAREAVSAAENQARAKQREQERRRQRQLAAVAAAAAAANRRSTQRRSASNNRQRSFGRSGFGSDSNSGSFSSGTSSSSWESGTSSSSW